MNFFSVHFGLHSEHIRELLKWYVFLITLVLLEVKQKCLNLENYVGFQP